ncbi:PREDICTED: GDSL esterase/lipase At5g45920 [Ipomoea nil]|uniref:GDSL esterase/lipase At5g45920 n=1 Tax=Ipomoea nil TaxID=35883 RepID=UPI0009012CC0|nr:PREDICTED: GDSL esterase/lipase At5g45920 [Ipomoea nil]
MRPKIYLFGDSITEMSFEVEDGGWGVSLADHFRRTADVVLRGFSGYNTRWALRIIDKAFPAEQGGGAPLAVTVFFGANDACVPDRCSSFQHVPVDEYKQNLCSIVSFFKKQWPTVHVILITPPPIYEPARLLYPFTENKSGLPERTYEAAGTYAKACLAVAAELGIPSVDLWIKVQEVPDWQTACLSDGLHLSRAGNAIVFKEVVDVLKKLGSSVETLMVDFPLIDDIDPNDPLKSFENLKN